ncbi:hypothetical protein IFM89_029594, partial [Coptis chinensis]
WHPYFLNLSAPKEGVVKKVHSEGRNLDLNLKRIKARMVFRGHGLDYDVDGLTGNTLDNHGLITFAGHRGYDKQNALVEELHLGYFTHLWEVYVELEKYSDHITALHTMWYVLRLIIILTKK